LLIEVQHARVAVLFVHRRNHTTPGDAQLKHPASGDDT
jgi:hypothetical protein